MNLLEITIEENNLFDLIPQYKGDMNLIIDQMKDDEIFRR
jgi:hypothetical protein